MRIPTWRLALTGGAVIVLAAAGLGFAAASSTPTAPAGDVAAAEATPTASPASPAGRGAGLGVRGQRVLRLGKHLVHAEILVTGRDGTLVTLQLDHGTVTAIGGGTLTISEAGGGSETVATNDATIVRVGRTKGDLGDVKVGVEVFVQSRVDGGAVTAKRIIVVPTKS